MSKNEVGVSHEKEDFLGWEKVTAEKWSKSGTKNVLALVLLKISP